MTTPVTGLDLRRVVGPWWLWLLLGLVGIAAGVIVLAWPAISLLTLAVVSGIFLLVDGAFELAVCRQPSGSPA
jgi:uncharacterized membrane protein HdeD (DUF308 family)